MSDTVSTAPVPETTYPPLSESYEPDMGIRLPSDGPVETSEGAPEPAPADTAPTGDKAPVEAQETPDEALDDDELQARNARLARSLREEKRKARQLELEAQALRGQRQEQPTEAMEREIANRAAAMAQQQAINAKANEIYTAGVKDFGRVEFDESVRAVNETFGQQMPVVIDTLTEIEHAEKLIQHLADNPDVADTIALLPPHKMGAALAREAAKLSAPKVKPVSKAPPPIRPIAQTSSAEAETNIENMSMAELDKLWTKRDNERRMGLR